MKKGVVLLLFLLLLATVCYAEKQRIGITETVILFTPGGLRTIEATIDTGADSSSIDIGLARSLGLIIHDKTRVITDSRGQEIRNTVELHFILADQEVYTVGTVANRTLLSNKMLIGKNDIFQFMVDPEESFLSVPRLPEKSMNKYSLILRHMLERNHIRIILLIPILSCMIIVFRHMLGLRTYGIFGPLVIALSMIQIGVLTGLILYLVLIFTGLLVKLLLNRLKLPLISEVSILMFVLSACTITLSIFFGFFYISLTGILFPLILTSFLIERFSQTLEIHTPREALTTLVLTLGVSLALAFFGAEMLAFTSKVLVLIFFVSLFVVILVSDYVGLRLSEIFRFKLLGKNEK